MKSLPVAMGMLAHCSATANSRGYRVQVVMLCTPRLEFSSVMDRRNKDLPVTGTSIPVKMKRRSDYLHFTESRRDRCDLQDSETPFPSRKARNRKQEDGGTSALPQAGDADGKGSERVSCSSLSFIAYDLTFVADCRSTGGVHWTSGKTGPLASHAADVLKKNRKMESKVRNPSEAFPVDCC